MAQIRLFNFVFRWIVCKDSPKSQSYDLFVEYLNDLRHRGIMKTETALWSINLIFCSLFSLHQCNLSISVWWQVLAFFNASLLHMTMNCRLTFIGQIILLKGAYLEKVAGVDKRQGNEDDELLRKESY